MMNMAFKSTQKASRLIRDHFLAFNLLPDMQMAKELYLVPGRCYNIWRWISNISWYFFNEIMLN